VLQLLEQGTPLKQITRRLNLGRPTVRRIARGGGLEVFRSRGSILEPYAETLDALWTGGCRNGAELWRRRRIQGFQGSLRVVAEWATRRRLDESSNPAGRVRKTPSAFERDQVPKDQASIMAKIADDVPPLLEARDLVDRFHEIMRQQKAADLDPSIVAANRKSTQLVRQGHHRGSRRRSSRDHPTMVERSDRRSNHKAQAGEASDVRACKNRSARGTRCRRRVNNCTKSKSERDLSAD
jgi:transposase